MFAAVWAASYPDAAQAATRIWDGSNSTSFTLGANWTTGIAPANTDIASFSGAFTFAPTITADDTVAGIIVSTNVTITLNPGVDLTVNGDFTQSSGTWNQGSGFLDISGNLNLSGTGIFRASSGRTEIGGAFNKTGGTFNANTGRLLLNSTSATPQTFASNGATFYDLHINDGLAGYWKLDEGSGTSATDVSGYGNSGTLSPASGPTWTTSVPTLGFTNTAGVVFDGVDDIISATSVNNLPAANAAQTISLWANLDVTTGTRSMVSLDNGSTSGIRVGVTANTLAVWKAGTIVLVSTSVPSTGAWHHVAYTYDGTTEKLYLDGTVTTATGTTHQTLATTAVYIGSSVPGSGYFFDGNLDDVRVYRRALSAAEINSLAIGNQPGTGVATQTLTGSPIIANDLVIDSGTLAAGTNAIQVAGNWWNYGGVYTGTGTVTFTGTTAPSTSNVIRSAGQPFGAITVNESGRTWTLADRLWAPGGAITITAGTLAASSYTIHAGTLTEAGTGFTPGTGTVVLDSSTDQAFGAANISVLKIEDPTEANLVGYWKLDEGQGTSLRDYSGNGNTGTLVNGAEWGTGTSFVSSTIGFDNPSGVTFSGDSTVDDHGTITAAGALAFNPNTSHITVAYWMYYTATPTASRNAVTLDHSGLLQTGFLRNGGVTYLAAWNSGGGGSPLASTSSIPAIGWHHFAYTWDGTNSKLYIDGGSPDSTTTNAPTSSTVASVWLGTYDGANELWAGRLDDVRIYNDDLTQAQIGALAAGRYAGTGGVSTMTLNESTTVNGAFAIDSGAVNTSSFNLTAANTDATQVAYVNAGTLTVGSGIAAFPGGLTVQPYGTLTMATSGGSVRIASGKTLIIDGTLNASSTGATIRNNGSGNYTFSVGSTATATPTLNITGLAVQNTDTNGMFVNANTSSVTTFTRFDNIAFSSGTGTRLLQLYGQTLYLSSNGCTFDSGVATGTTTYAVTLAGNGSTGSPDTTETRAVFGGTTCADNWTTGPADRICLAAAKSDDDADSNGIGDTPASNGAVAQFIRGGGTDTAGTIEGLPTAAFDWSDFSYYSTYVAFHDVSGTVDRVYVRSQTGTAEYSWDTPSGETIVGTPKWNTISGSHYLFVALASGKVYRLIDNTTSLTEASGWPANPYNCSCAITSPLGQDGSNLYWGGTASGNKVFTLGQSSGAAPGPAITITPAVTTAAPATWTNAGTTYLFLGTVGNVVEINATSQLLAATNTNPGSASVYGRISIGTNGANRVFAGDDSGDFWALDPLSFTGTNKHWSYTVSGDVIQSSPFSDYTTNTVTFGTNAGKVVSLNAATGAALTGYPYTPGTSSDAIQNALLYRAGILAVGTTTGKLFFLDRNNGTTGPALIRQYYFGPTQSVSGVGYDASGGRYMVSTSDSTLKDGRLYYIDAISDPTGGSS